MVYDTKTMAGVLGETLRQMNSHINENGKIQPSSQVIKNWHEYDNCIWIAALEGIKILSEAKLIKLPRFVENDVDFLHTHIQKCADYTDNVLYPTPKETGRLPDAVTHANRAKHDRTIKSTTFRTMMNVREALNQALDIYLPNDDDSKGGLDPTPYEKFF